MSTTIHQTKSYLYLPDSNISEHQLSQLMPENLKSQLPTIEDYYCPVNACNSQNMNLFKVYKSLFDIFTQSAQRTQRTCGTSYARNFNYAEEHTLTLVLCRPDSYIRAKQSMSLRNPP